MKLEPSFYFVQNFAKMQKKNWGHDPYEGFFFCFFFLSNFLNLFL